jgi:2'-5' RNA ligase
MNRLFISLNLPNEIIDQLIKIRHSIWDVNNINWESPEKLHLTLKFIGDVTAEIKDSILNELKFLETHSEIYCTINKFDFFYRDSKPLILFAGLQSEVSLNTIKDQINKKLEKFSIPLDYRKLNPHITLLRIKKDTEIDFVNSFKNFSFTPIHFTANSLTLYKSELNKNGSKYIAIKNYKLKELEK